MPRYFFSLFCLVPLALGCAPTASTGADVDSAEVASADAAATAEDASESASDDGMLTIGSTAPRLDVSHWYPTELEDAEPITQLGSGEVHVVEFWATWCGPCVSSIPHINEMQKSYGDRGVTFVSITREDTETVEPFFERTVRGEEGDDAPIYGDLMKAYRVGSDPDGSTNRDYMEAAGQNGIPCAFIVGKTGKVEWIGHPMAMSEILERVVEDQWDREAYAKEFKAKKRMEALMQQIGRAFQQGDAEKANELLDKMLAESDDPRMKARVAGIREQMSLQMFYTKLGEDPEKDLDELRTRVAAFEGDLEQINRFVWPFAAISAQGGDVSDDLLKLAAELTEAALAETPGVEDGNVLDTLAHLYHEQGDLPKAIERQRQAVAADNPPGIQQQLQSYLDQLLVEQKSLEEPAEEEATPEAT